MNRAGSIASFSQVVLTMARREAFAAIGGPGLYVAASVALVAAVWLLNIDLRALHF